MSSSQFRHCPNLPQKKCQMKKVNISVSDVKITSLPFAREVYDKTDGSFQPPNKDQSLVRHQAIIWGKCGHNVNPPAMDQHPASHLQSAKNKVMSHILIIHHSYPTLFPFMSQVVDISWYFCWFNMVYTWFIHGFTVYPVMIPSPAAGHQLPSGESKAPPPPRFRAALRMEASRLKPPEEAPGPSPGWPWLTPKDEFEVRGSHGVHIVLGILPGRFYLLAVFSILHDLMRSPQEILLAQIGHKVYTSRSESLELWIYT